MVGADHWLVPPRRQIDNGKPTVTKSHWAFNPMPFAIWTAVSDSIRHTL
jgi:hypothetical protein